MFRQRLISIMLDCGNCYLGSPRPSRPSRPQLWSSSAKERYLDLQLCFLSILVPQKREMMFLYGLTDPL